MSEKVEAWTCGRCDQVNPHWSTECGRCGLESECAKDLNSRRITMPPSSSPWRRIEDGPVEFPAILLCNNPTATKDHFIASYWENAPNGEYSYTHWQKFIPPEPAVPAEEQALRNAIKEYTGGQHVSPNGFEASAFEQGWKAHAEFARKEKEWNP